MTELESYAVSARQLLSSKHVPESGRVCSWRKPIVWPSSWRITPVSDHGLMFENEEIETRISRPLRLVLGKNARARYCAEFTMRMLNTTPVVRREQSPSYCDACTKLTFAGASHAPAAEFIALTIAL